MGRISEGNEAGEVEIDERDKERKEQDVTSEKKSIQDIFSDKTVSFLGRKSEKRYSIDHMITERKNIRQGKKDAHPYRVKSVTVT